MEAKIEKISELSKLLSVKTRMSDDLCRVCRVSLQFDLYALIDCTLYVELIFLAINFIILTILISEALGRRTFIHHSPTLVA